MIWTNEYLNRLTLEAEIAIAREIQCIVGRLSIFTEENIFFYQLPDYINNIKRVFWKGMRLDSVDQAEYEEWIYTLSQKKDGAFYDKAFSSAFFIGQEATSTPISKPMRYFYSSFGENVIVFHPNVNETIDAIPWTPSAENPNFLVQEGLFGANIASAVIIEFYMIPDPINGIKIPEYIRRRTIKNYVLWKAFQKEGDGQNLRAADYHRNRYLVNLTKAKSIIDRVYTAVKRQRNAELDRMEKIPARPVLPVNWQTVTVYEDEEC